MRHLITANLQRHRTVVLGLSDMCAWLLAFVVSAALRFETFRFSLTLDFDDNYGTIPLYGCLVLAGIAASVHLMLAWLLRLHQGRHGIASFEELATLVTVSVIAGAVATIVNYFTSPLIFPRLSVVSATALAILFMVWPRFIWRLQVSNFRKGFAQRSAAPVLIVGAGSGGQSLVQSMHGDPQHGWLPVAFLDDDPQKRHFRFQGVKVKGKTGDLPKVAERLGITTVIIAMPSVSAKVIRSLNEAALEAGLTVKVLPSVNEILDDVSVAQVRDIEPADLLGRHQIEIDLQAISHHLRGRTVLVTGAGGSIGSELCRQIREFTPGRLVMLDRDESALHALALTIDGRADLESPDMVLADIRDRARLLDIFNEIKPEVVFHAAALKHVNILQQHPVEAFKTNVVGTENILDASVSTAVSLFVNISTDKAADPQNSLGYSKRIAEGLTATTAAHASGTYVSVRFGNVLGTRGSVLTTFQAQIDRGDPVTVTDREVTRFFMTVSEAVQLVIQAAAIGFNGEALVLDMGEPVKIDDVARQMIQNSRRPIDVVYTGLKPGEKLHEVLFAEHETDTRPFHPLISHVAVPPLSKESLEHLRSSVDRVGVDVENAMRIVCAAMVTRAGEPSDEVISVHTDHR